MPVIYISYPLTVILAQFIGIGIGMWTAYFSIINATSHVVLALKNKRYNPGFVVSLLANIPFGIYTIWYMNANAIINLSANVGGLILGTAVQGIVMFYGFAILKPRMKSE